MQQQIKTASPEMSSPEGASQEIMKQGLTTRSIRFEPLWRVGFQAPPEDVERIMQQVCAVTPLRMGAYDRCAYQAAGGTERYRPLEGAAAGPETETRLRPGVVEVSFQLERDRDLLERVAEAIFAVHSYQEPVITVEEIVASRSRGLDDKDNPHRWWNQGGDWKKKDAVP